MAGLLAARVLADAYAEVVVVERDELPHAAAHRRGVPQSRHIHGLLAAGPAGPGGALRRSHRRAGRSRGTGGRPARGPPGLLRGSPPATRSVGPAGAAGEPADARGGPARTSAHAAVRGSSWTGAMSPDSPPHPTAAASPARGWSDDSTAARSRPLAADLVVDATGRGSRTPAWLEMLGYPRPPVDRVRDRHRVRQPDLPARPRTARRTTWESSTRRHPIIRAAEPSPQSRTTASSSPCSESSATTRRPIPRASPTSPPPCSSRTSAKPCATQNRSTSPSRSATPPACDTATNGSRGFPTASW